MFFSIVIICYFLYLRFGFPENRHNLWENAKSKGSFCHPVSLWTQTKSWQRIALFQVFPKTIVVKRKKPFSADHQGDDYDEEMSDKS